MIILVNTSRVFVFLQGSEYRVHAAKQTSYHVLIEATSHEPEFFNFHGINYRESIPFEK